MKGYSIFAIVLAVLFTTAALSQPQEPVSGAKPVKNNSDEILKHEHRGTFTKEGTDIEITAVEPTEGGVQVFAKASRNGKPLGFGKSGSIETERIRVVNPPLLVPDGTCIDTQIERPNGSIAVVCLNNYVEDPQEALRVAVAKTVKHIAKDKRPTPGTVGNTTTTVFSDASDGTIRGDDATWATVRAAASGDQGVVAASASAYSIAGDAGAVYEIYTPFFPFDTSGIPSTDTISSATLTFTLAGDNNGDANNDWALGQTNQATWNSLIAGDFDQRGYNGSEGAARINRVVTAATTGDQTFTLNATGIGFIARSGETKPAGASASGKTQLSLLMTFDIDNTTPTTYDYNLIYFSEQAGTTDDPVLVVEHAAAANVSPEQTVLFE